MLTHSRVCTINLHKRLHKITFKNRAPRAIREIKKFAEKNMGTKCVFCLDVWMWMDVCGCIELMGYPTPTSQPKPHMTHDTPTAAWRWP